MQMAVEADAAADQCCGSDARNNFQPVWHVVSPACSNCHGSTSTNERAEVRPSGHADAAIKSREANRGATEMNYRGSAGSLLLCAGLVFLGGFTPPKPRSAQAIAEPAKLGFSSLSQAQMKDLW